jgi:uncharacterized membrane protein YebE (DUF533 family)
VLRGQSKSRFGYPAQADGTLREDERQVGLNEVLTGKPEERCRWLEHVTNKPVDDSE